jgi:ribosomal protein S18 acetylase RimI-like enzyme
MMNETMSSIKEVSLRHATVADAAAIAAVRIDSWLATYRGVMPDAFLDGMKLEDSVVHWRTILEALPAAGERICVFVAESGGVIIGFASGMLLAQPKHGMGAELTAVYLLPEWQRSGIGRRMVQKVARTLQAQGSDSLLVWVIANNTMARNFYEELGGALLVKQKFNWDGLELMEAGYGWQNLSVLMASVNAIRSSASLH